MNNKTSHKFVKYCLQTRLFFLHSILIWCNKCYLSHDDASGSDITSRNKMDKPLVHYKVAKQMAKASIILTFSLQKCDF